MATTTKGVTYAAGTDAASDIDARMQALAEWVDARPGIAPLTEAARNALAAPDLWVGKTIFNTTRGWYESWDGAAWGRLIGGKPRPVADGVIGPKVAGGTPVRVYSAPGAVNTILYTVPAGKVAVVQQFSVFNSHDNVWRFRVAVNGGGGGGMAGAGIVAYDSALGYGESAPLLECATLQAGATIVVWSTNVSQHFTLLAIEYTAADIGEVPKILGSANPGSVWTDLYTVPANTIVILRRLHVANVGAVGAVIRDYHVRFQIGGSTDYLVSPTWLPQGEWDDDLVENVVLPAGHKVQVYGGGTDVTFNLFGSEVAA